MYNDYELTHDQNDVAIHKEIQPALSTLIVVVIVKVKVGNLYTSFQPHIS